MLHSLRARLLLLWVLLSVAALVVAALLVQFQGRSAAAQIGRASSQVAQACDAIRGRFDFYAAGWDGSGSLTDAAARSALGAAVALALGPFPGVEGRHLAERRRRARLRPGLPRRARPSRRAMRSPRRTRRRPAKSARC